MRPRFTLLGACLALSTLGCGEEFTKPSKLVDPRVLAVQAEPPQPKLGETTVLRPLTYLPKGGTATYQWSWCPIPTNPNDGYKCHITQEQLGFFLPAINPALAGVPVSLTLPAGDTASLTNIFPASSLKDLCDGKLEGLPKELQKAFTCGVAGFPVQVRVDMDASAPDEDGKLKPYSQSTVLTLFLPINDNAPVNHNPVIRGLKAQRTFLAGPDGGVTEDALPPAPAPSVDAGLPGDSGSEDVGAADGAAADDAGAGAPVDAEPLGPTPDADVPPSTADDPSVRLDETGSVVATRHADVLLTADVTQDAAESYAYDKKLDGYDWPVNPDKSFQYTERLTLSWFSEGGEFDDDGEQGTHTGFNLMATDQNRMPIPFRVAIEEKLKTPKRADFAGDQTRLIVVIRDNRGGVAWTSATLGLSQEELK